MRLNQANNISSYNTNSLSQQLTWTNPPTNVLVVKKDCLNVFESFTTIITYLIEHHHLNLFIEEKDFNHEVFNQNSQILDYKTSKSLRIFVPCVDFECLSKQTINLDDQIDLILCLGGDGTLLHVSTLFQVITNPILDNLIK